MDRLPDLSLLSHAEKDALIHALRAQVQARWAGDESRRRAFWFELITPEFLDLAVAGRDEDVEQAIRRCLSQS